jgi:uncharacterized protein YciI
VERAVGLLETDGSAASLARACRFLLVGPLGGGPKVLLIVRAQNDEEVEDLLASDPWTGMGLLETISIEPWDLKLGSIG